MGKKEKLSMDEILDEDNIASILKEQTLLDIGKDVVTGFDLDLNSRSMWEKKSKEALELAMQVTKIKNTPWQNASNIKYPLMTIATIQFAARAYPALIQGRNVAKIKPVGNDDDGQKAKRASRISTHMNYQIFEEIDNWEEDMDTLLHVTPIVGLAFKKMYPSEMGLKSEFVHPEDFVVDYYTKDLKTCYRQTQIVPLYTNEFIEQVRRGSFIEIELSEAGKPKQKVTEPTGAGKPSKSIMEIQNNGGHTEPEVDQSSAHYFLEQHTWLDLDDDGYKEPYIVTVHWRTGKVVRIEPRFRGESIEWNDNMEVVMIEADQYYVKYGFIPSPDGSFYDIGFGQLLAPLNEAVNTFINQLTDSGTLNNLGGGFISSSLISQSGALSFKPGEYKKVNMHGDDIRKGIVDKPTHEPSSVLFSLLGMLIQSGEKLASITDPMTGQSPGTHVPYSTTATLIDQGMKVYSGIVKRNHRSLKKELQIVFKLNQLFLDPAKYNAILDSAEEAVDIKDYDNTGMDIVPYSDPAMGSEPQKISQAEGMMELLDRPEVDNREIISRYLTVSQVEDPEKIIPMEKMKQPDPQMLMALADKENDKTKLEIKKLELEMKVIKLKAEAEKATVESIDILARMEDEVTPAGIEDAIDKHIAIKGDLDGQETKRTNANQERTQGMEGGEGDQMGAGEPTGEQGGY